MNGNNKFQPNWVTLNSQTDCETIYAPCPFHCLKDETEEHKCATIKRRKDGEKYILKMHGFFISDKLDSLEEVKSIAVNIFDKPFRHAL